jgi:hypothetical protein
MPFQLINFFFSCAMVRVAERLDVWKRGTVNQGVLYSEIHFGITMNQLTQAIWDGNVLIGTDGSVLNNKATYATVIIIDLDNENPTFAASAGGKLPSLAKFIDMDSHQPEAAALFASLVLTCTLLKEYPPSDQSKPQATQLQH